MREIKFRAWNRLSKTMWQPDTRTNWEFLRDVDYSNTRTEKMILMQYTGLKDRHGVEIYEGDIVREHTGFSDEGGDYPVEYQANGFWLEGRDNEFGFGDESELEVIGNIYENKDLLS